MAYTTINKSTSYFDTKTWSGNNTDPTTISGLNFQKPGLRPTVWILVQGFADKG